MTHIAMKAQCSKEDLLEDVRKNRENHAKMVAEARACYVAQAMAELQDRLEELRSGKASSLLFALQVPQDYTKEYDTVIGMLEAHTEPIIELTASDYKQFVQDEWGWSHVFAGVNSAYSKTTADWARDKGYT